MKDLIKDTPRPSLIKRNIPPLYKDLLIWTNREYNPTTHQLKSRITPAYNVTLKQGLCAESDGVDGVIIYPNSVLNSIVPNNSSITNLEIEIKFAKDYSATIANKYLLKDNGIGWGLRINATSNKEIDFYAVSPTLGTTNRKVIFSRNIVAGDLVKIVFVGGGTDAVPNSTVAGYLNGTLDALPASINTDKIYNSATTRVFQIFSGSTNSFAFCGVRISVNNVAKFDARFSGSYNDLISGTAPTSTTGVSFVRSDYSSFYSDEYGFAVKSGVIYPKLLDGSGYAGLVGDPDATYQGLIALQGGIEAGAQNYLKTLFDFQQTVNTEIESAGLILDDYTALDCNDDLIYTADPYLDPLTYPNAFTAMTLANVSQQRYSDLADNNSSRRIFIKYRRGTDVTDDGSRALITAGTIAEILVYKRDLSVAEAIRVLKYCADMPMDNQVMLGDEPTLDGDNNFIFSCTGHTEPEIEIEEP